MDAKTLLNTLTLENYESIFYDLGVEEIRKNTEYWILPTLCHNLDISSASYKLYFYLNTRTLFCFTECQKSRNVIDLIIDRWNLEGRTFRFPDVLNYICKVCGINNKDNLPKCIINPLSWKKRLEVYQPTKSSHYLGKRYDKQILNYLPKYYHEAFLRDGISSEVMDKFGIGFYPPRHQITIPVFDLNGGLVGIHCRNLDPKELERGKKYIPLHTICGMDYRFKSHEILYGLNMNIEYIKHTKQIQLFEAPKSVLQLSTMYEQNNGVGMFGLNLNKNRRDMILELGVSEVIIGIDKDYTDIYDKTYATYCHNANKIATLFRGYCNVSVLYDDKDLLGYKDSPTDKGKEVYEYLYNNRRVVNQ